MERSHKYLIKKENDKNQQITDRESLEVYGIVGNPRRHDFLRPELHGLTSMRVITLLVIHCSAVRPDQRSSAKDIDKWHREDRHYKCIGYHYVIRRDGTIEPGRPEWMVGAHCLNHNAHSIGICYEGGYDARGQPVDTRTTEQKATMRQLLEELHERYPRALIVGHRDLTHDRDCPCFDTVKAYADLQPK